MRLAGLTAVVSLGYFFIWTAFGMAAFPVGVALATIEMQQPALALAVPAAVGVVVVIAGALQFTAWKARHLSCCREAPRARASNPVRCRHGLATRPAPGNPLQSVLRESDRDPAGHRCHGPSGDGGRDGIHHCRTSRTVGRACRTSQRGHAECSRVVPDRTSRRARMTGTFRPHAVAANAGRAPPLAVRARSAIAPVIRAASRPTP